MANPATGDKTIVEGTDDGSGGQFYIYAGNKSDSPYDIDAAGLKNGVLSAIQVAGLPVENDAIVFTSGPFSTVNPGDVTTWSGAKLNTETAAAGATTFARPEDSCWAPSRPNDLAFDSGFNASGACASRLRFFCCWGISDSGGMVAC